MILKKTSETMLNTLSGCKQHEMQYSYIAQQLLLSHVSQEYWITVEKPSLQQPFGKISCRGHTKPSTTKTILNTMQLITTIWDSIVSK